MAAKMTKSDNKQSLALLLSKRNKVYSKSRAEEAFALPSFPEATTGGLKATPAPCVVDVEHPVEINVEKLRHTMLQHEAVFKEQLHELHRLYQVQQSLMAKLEKKDTLRPLPNQPPFNGSFMHASNSSNTGEQFKFQDAMGGSTISFGHPQPVTMSESEQWCTSTHLKSPQGLMHQAEMSKLKMRPPQVFDLEQPAEMYMGSGKEEERQSKFGLTSTSKPPHLLTSMSSSGVSARKELGLPTDRSPCSANIHASMVNNHVEIERDYCLLPSTSFEGVGFHGGHTRLSHTEHPLSTQNFLGGLLEPCQESACINKPTEGRDFNKNKTNSQVPDSFLPFQMPFQGSCASPVMKPPLTMQDPVHVKSLSWFPQKSPELDLNNKLDLYPEEKGLRNPSHDLLMAQTIFHTSPQEQQVLLSQSGPPSRVLLTSRLANVFNKLPKEPKAPFPGWVREDMSAMHSKSQNFETDMSMMPPQSRRAVHTSSSEWGTSRLEVSSWMQQASIPESALSSSHYLSPPPPDVNMMIGSSNAGVLGSFDKRDVPMHDTLKTKGRASDMKAPSLPFLDIFPSRPALGPISPAAGSGLLLDLNVEVSAPLEESSFDLFNKHGKNIGLSSSDIEMVHEGGALRKNNCSTARAENTINRTIDHDSKMVEARAADAVAMERGQEPGKLDEFITKSALQQDSASTLSLEDASKVIAAEDTVQTRSVCWGVEQSECYGIVPTSMGVVNENLTKAGGQQVSGLSSEGFNNGNASFDLRDAGDVMIHKGSDASGVTSCESPEGVLLANANIRDLSNSNSGNTCQSLDSGFSFCQGSMTIAATSSNVKAGNGNGKRCGEEIFVMGGYQEDLTLDRFSVGGISSSGVLASTLVKAGHCKYDGTEINCEDLGDDMPVTLAHTDEIVNILLSMGLERPLEVVRQTVEGPSSLGLAVDTWGQENLSYSKRRKAGALDHSKLPMPISATRAIDYRIKPEDSLDEFEAAILALKPDSMDTEKEWLQNFQRLQVSGKYQSWPAPKTKSKRRRMGRDFQMEMLPSITSLSRQEMNEDMQTISALLRVTTNEASSPSLRDECFSRVAIKARGRLKRSPCKVTKASQGEDFDEPLKIGSWVDSGRRRMQRNRAGRHFLHTNSLISSFRK